MVELVFTMEAKRSAKYIAMYGIPPHPFSLSLSLSLPSPPSLRSQPKICIFCRKFSSIVSSPSPKRFCFQYFRLHPTLYNMNLYSPILGRFYDTRFEDHQPHFLESCFLCKKALGNQIDIFMYKVIDQFP